MGVRATEGTGKTAAAINRHLSREAAAVARALYSFFPRARWLTHPAETALNKVHALRLAAAAGLEIPPTLVTNQRAEIEEFRRRHGRVITKSVGEVTFIPLGERTFGLYTAEAEADDVAALPEVLFPSLVQALVEKEFEIRVFCLGGELWPMAIFSQGSERTAMDFRQYDVRRPSRSVPYRLPQEIAASLRAFLREAGLTSGSVDLIRTPDGRHVFLEVNPAGQFLMVSNPCNYRLQKRVAEHLIRESAHAAA
jgi:glutathione synthase/RimK-type ligase-like ATP-grasp enzyme